MFSLEASGGERARTRTSTHIYTCAHHPLPVAFGPYSTSPYACSTLDWHSWLPAPPSTPRAPPRGCELCLLLPLPPLGAPPRQGFRVRILPAGRDSRAGVGGTVQVAGCGLGHCCSWNKQRRQLSAQDAMTTYSRATYSNKAAGPWSACTAGAVERVPGGIQRCGGEIGS